MIKTFIIATAILTCTTVALSQPTEDSGPTYSMVMEYRGDAYVIDHGMSFGEAGRVIDYDPAAMADLIMTDIPDGEDHTSADGFESMTQSEWQDGDNGYRWRVRF